MEKVLVMGGSLFIGKHVVETLKNDYEVSVLNRGNHPLNDSAIQELIADRNDEAQLKDALMHQTFDHIIDISGFTQRHVESLVNCLTPQTLKSFTFISSGAVYDLSQPMPFKETDALGGHSPYGKYAANKIDAERYLQEVFTDDTLSIIRPPFVYGEDNYLPRERFIFKRLENEQPIFIPKTNNTIQFVYVKDLANLIKGLVNQTIDHGTYNVGTKKAITFKAFVDTCAKAIGKTPHIQWFDPDHTPHPPHHLFPFLNVDYALDVKKINTQYTDETPLLKGLQNAYKDYVKIKGHFSIPDQMKQALSDM